MTDFTYQNGLRGFKHAVRSVVAKPNTLYFNGPDKKVVVIKGRTMDLGVHILKQQSTLELAKNEEMVKLAKMILAAQ